MLGSGVSLRKRLFNTGSPACPRTQHKHRLISDTLHILFPHFLINYHSNAEIFAAQLIKGLLCLNQTGLFFPPLSPRCVLQPFPPVSHSSTFLCKPTHQVSGFYSWFTLAAPISCAPLPLCTLFLLLSPLPPADLCLSWLAGRAAVSKGEYRYVDSHSLI